jgi:CheY-like chemotaxis protein
MESTGETALAKILLVDDDPKVRRSVEVALQAAGHEVCQAAGPDEALEVAAEAQPDLMLVDVMMPSGTEGFQLVWKVRTLEDERLRDVPIIMVTGIHEQIGLRFYPEETDGTYEAGEFLPVQGWLDKPVRVAELHEKIESVLGG